MSRKNKNFLRDPNLDLAIWLVPRSEDLPVPVFEELPQVDSLPATKNPFQPIAMPPLQITISYHLLLSPQLFPWKA